MTASERREPVDLAAAAKRLRDSVAALPAHHKGSWQYDESSLFMDGSARGSIRCAGWPAAVSNASFSPGVGEHVALAASPPTVLLLADLLEAVADIAAQAIRMPAPLAVLAIKDIRLAAEALAAALLNGATDER